MMKFALPLGVVLLAIASEPGLSQRRQNQERPTVQAPPTAALDAVRGENLESVIIERPVESQRDRQRDSEPAEPLRNSEPEQLMSREDAELQLYIAADADPAAAMQLRMELFDQSLRQLVHTPVDTPAYFELARQALHVGNLMGEHLLAGEQLVEARDVIARMDRILAGYPESRVPPPLVLAFARLLLLKDRLSDIEASQPPDDVDARILRLTANPDINPGDFVPLMEVRHSVLWRAREGDAQESRRQACIIAEQIDRVVWEEGNILRLIECQLLTVAQAKSHGDFRVAAASLNRAREIAQTAISDNPDSVRAALNLVEVELNAAEVALAQRRTDEQARRRMAAADAFARALRGRPLPRQDAAQVRNYYFRFRDTDLVGLPEYGTAAARRAANVAMFQPVAEVLVESWRASPGSTNYALLAGDAQSNLATLYRDSGNLAAADERSAIAASAFRGGGIIATLTRFDEDANLECGVLSNRVQILVEMRQANDALPAYRDLERSCGGWLQRFPWDFLVRQEIGSAAEQLGRLLHQEHRYGEAMPILRYASDWGSRESSLYIADIYRHGRGVPADSSRAESFASLGARQSIRRVPLSVSIGGALASFTVQVLEYGAGDHCPIQAEPLPAAATCVGFEGIDDQVEWVKRARGAVVSADVAGAFRRLNQIARENNASFPDITAYALEQAQRSAAAPPAPAAAGANGAPPRTGTGRRAGRTARAGASPAASGGTPAAAVPADAAAAPVYRNARFFVEDTTNQTPLTETFVVPHRVNSICFNWQIAVDPEQRTVALREEFELPGPTPNWGGITAATVVSDGGRHVTTQLEQSLAGGYLTNGWCIAEDDPVGPHRISVYFGDRLLHRFDFEVMREEAPRPGA